MTDCIKTGAYVYLENYNAYSPADIYQVWSPGNDHPIFIVRLNPEHTWSYEPLRPVTHIIPLFDKDSSFFWNKEAGIAVVPHLVEVK